MTKIFFSRSYVDYNTKYEEQCINKIKRSFQNCSVINFKEIKTKIYNGKLLLELEKKYFFPLIESSDIVITAKTKNSKYQKLNNRYSKGVLLEIEYAKKINKQVTDIEAIEGVLIS